jgi:hypothetical protein
MLGSEAHWAISDCGIFLAHLHPAVAQPLRRNGLYVLRHVRTWLQDLTWRHAVAIEPRCCSPSPQRRVFPRQWSARTAATVCTLPLKLRLVRGVGPLSVLSVRANLKSESWNEYPKAGRPGR